MVICGYAHGLRVQIPDNGALLQIGVLETQYKPIALALNCFAIDEQAQPLLEGEALDIALASLFLECFRHAGEPKHEQPIVGGMSEHFSSSSLVGPPVCGRAPRMRAVFRRARSDVLRGSRGGMHARTLSTESRTSRIGLITLDAKQTGERKAGNPPIAFDVAGTGNVAWSREQPTRLRV